MASQWIAFKFLFVNITLFIRNAIIFIQSCQFYIVTMQLDEAQEHWITMSNLMCTFEKFTNAIGKGCKRFKHILVHMRFSIMHCYPYARILIAQNMCGVFAEYMKIQQILMVVMLHRLKRVSIVLHALKVVISTLRTRNVQAIRKRSKMRNWRRNPMKTPMLNARWTGRMIRSWSFNHF